MFPFGPVLDFAGNALQNLGSSSAASANRKFQAEQSGTAYQRAVKDMRAAGLNPALAYSQGGASSGGGATAPVVSPFQGATQSITNSARTKAEIDLLKEQATGQVIKNNLMTQIEGPQGLADLTTKQQEAAQAEIETRMMGYQVPGLQLRGNLWDAARGVGNTVAEGWRRIGERINQAADSPWISRGFNSAKSWVDSQRTPSSSPRRR